MKGNYTGPDMVSHTGTDDIGESQRGCHGSITKGLTLESHTGDSQRD